MTSLEKKLEAIEKRYEEITNELAKPEVVSDPASYQKHAKARSELEPIVDQYRRLKSTLHQLSETQEMLGETDEEELRALAQEELERLGIPILPIQTEDPVDAQISRLLGYAPRKPRG